jgi:MerR family transcriptional regulator, light-induced transcriptional regulator
MADALDLQHAAERLGVHYQTAYRWVRDGRLPAERLGGRYRIAVADLDALVAERSTPRSEPKPPGPARLERQAIAMHHALVEGDEPSARRIARALVAEGTAVVDLIEHVLVPPLVAIGQDWHDGRLSIWVEHRASAICERLLGDVMPNPRGRRRGVALVAAVTGDRHSLPTTMATAVLRADNWHVHHLGADMPVDQIVAFAVDHDVDLAVLTVTNPKVAAVAGAAGRQLTGLGATAIVGGPGRSLRDLTAAARASTA